jgi:hypothetical protein
MGSHYKAAAYVLLVEETGVPGENHRPVASHGQTLSHNVISSTPLLRGVRTHNISGDKLKNIFLFVGFSSFDEAV